MLEKYPRLRRQNFDHPRVDDYLFETSYNHAGAAECKSCDKAYLVSRQARDEDDLEPVVHYGTIGSANQVMRDGATRDRLRQDYNILCVEMEAAGLMDNFPCLVIRGICDYADTHKSKVWQGYAAAVAAGYAKELLGLVPELSTASTAAELMVSDLIPLKL